MACATEVLHSQVSKLIPDSKRIVLDFTDLVYMDSMGLGAVVHLYVSAETAGCDLSLINFGKTIRKLLDVTNLLSFFEERNIPIHSPVRRSPASYTAAIDPL